jgi:hypothetical protein
VPHSFDELRSVRHTLELYRRNYAVHIAALLVAVHMFLQAFMMPGSILINVLAGSMYSLPGGSGLPLGWACHWSGAARPPAGMLPAQGHARMWRGVYRTKQ